MKARTLLLQILLLASLGVQAQKHEFANWNRYAQDNKTIGLPAKGEHRVVLMGNSITDGGHYHSYIWLYYMTRFPYMDLRVMNAGIGGETAGDCG